MGHVRPVSCLSAIPSAACADAELFNVEGGVTPVPRQADLFEEISIGSARSRTLCAILLNPALRPLENTITFRNVRSALPLVGCTELVTANLLNVITKDAPALNRAAVREQESKEAREMISAALHRADEVLLAWGMGGMTGDVRIALQGQATWLLETLGRRDLQHVWTVAGGPRHPSRWRQYVGPEKQRVAGSSFEERLGKVLSPTLLDSDAGRALFERAF